MNDADRIAFLEHEIETITAFNAAIYTAVSALLQRHSDKEQLVVHLSSLTERVDAGAVGEVLNGRQRDLVRLVLEELQRLASPSPENRTPS